MKEWFAFLAIATRRGPHIHLPHVPVTSEQEELWRQGRGPDYERGRFFEFLGDQERDARTASRVSLATDDVTALRRIAGTHDTRSP